MSVKDICLSHKTIAVSSEFGGVEIKAIDYGIDDYVYCVSGCLCENEDLRKYHHAKIHYEFSLDREDSRPYIKLLDANRKYHKLYLDECLRTEDYNDRIQFRGEI